MKKIFILNLTALLIGSVSSAYNYECNLIETNSQKSMGKFTFDTDQEPNKFITVDNNIGIGCIKFESQSPLIGCVISHGDQHYTSTADLGVKIIGLAGPINGQNLSLVCLKYNK